VRTVGIGHHLAGHGVGRVAVEKGKVHSRRPSVESRFLLGPSRVELIVDHVRVPACHLEDTVESIGVGVDLVAQEEMVRVDAAEGGLGDGVVAVDAPE